MSQREYKVEPKSKWIQRHFPLNQNIDGGFSTWPIKPHILNGKQYGHGGIYKIGDIELSRNISKNEVLKLLKNLHNDGKIYEEFFPDFCKGTTNGSICCSTKFHQDPVNATKTCRVCSVEQNQIQYNMTRSMNSEGKINHNNSNCAPKGIHISTSRGNNIGYNEKKYLRTRDIENYIRFIAHSFPTNWQDIEFSALNKLNGLYDGIHPGVTDQQISHNKQAMPSGKAAVAAACLFGSILEKKFSNGPVLGDIIKHANNLNADTVDAKKVIQRMNILSKHGLLKHSLIPHFRAPSTHYNSDTQRIQTLHTAFINSKETVLENIVFLPKIDLGLTVQQTIHGVLQIKSISSDKIEWKLRKNDFIMKVQGIEIPVNEMPSDFYKRIQDAKDENSPSFSFEVRRKRNTKTYRKPKGGKRKRNDDEQDTSKKTKIVA